MFDIKRFCADYGLSIAEEGHHHCHTGWAQLHCPFCTNGRDGFHLGFSLERGNLNCWRCGIIQLWDYLREILRTDNNGILFKTIQDYQTIGSKKAQKDITRKKKLITPTNMKPMDQAHRRYLRRRGFNPWALERDWGVQGTGPLGGLWKWRVVYPIRNSDGDIIAYQGRSIIKDQKPKYKLTDKDQIQQNQLSILYGIERVPGKSVIVVEGVTGVWKIGPGSVATLGIDWHQEQARILRRFKNKFILFDPEDKAQTKAKELAKWLSFFPGKTEVVSGFKTDPGDFDPITVEKVRQLLKD